MLGRRRHIRSNAWARPVVSKNRRRRNKNSVDQQPPDTFKGVLIRLLWSRLRSLKTPWRVAIVLVVGAFGIGFIIWETMPEPVQTDLWTMLFKLGPTSTEQIDSSSPQAERVDTMTSHIVLPEDPQPQPRASISNDQSIVSEMDTKGLSEVLDKAEGYLGTGNLADKEKGLQLYRLVVSELSPEARQMLDQELLREAQTAYEAMDNDRAISRYRTVFSDYRTPRLRKSLATVRGYRSSH